MDILDKNIVILKFPTSRLGIDKGQAY